MGPHSDAGVGAEAGHHKGHRRDGAVVGSLPTEAEAEEEYGVHSPLDHNNPVAWEWAIAPGSDPGGCIHGVLGTFCHILPWEGRPDVGSETDRGLGRDGHQSWSGSVGKHEMGDPSYGPGQNGYGSLHPKCRTQQRL